MGFHNNLDDDIDRICARVNAELARPEPQATVKRAVTRRVMATKKRIEDTIEVGKQMGLTATSVSHYPSGLSVVHFGDGTDAEVTQHTKQRKGAGWEDV